jgi:hypothetical protein
MNINESKRFGHFGVEHLDGKPNTDDERWGSFVRVDGWVYAFYWGGTAFCKPCDSGDEADRICNELRSALNHYGFYEHNQAENHFIELCNDWPGLGYYGGMSTRIDNAVIKLPTPTCSY